MEFAPMTKRDKILLYFVLMVAFVVLYIRFLLIPGIENHQQAAADLVEAETAQTTMQDTILMASANAAQKNTNWGELQTANAVYYSLLSSDELDTLVTGLELNHNLQPESLSIGQPVTQNLGWYVASADAGRTAGPSAAADTAVTAGDAAATAEGNAVLQQFLAADLVPQYDAPGYFRTAAISFSCSGAEEDFLALLDDLAANYPSVQLNTFSMDTRSYANMDGTSSTGTVFTVALSVILCDKGGVQP